MWRLNVVQPSGLVGLGYGVGFNLNGGMWDSLSPAHFFLFFTIFILGKNDIIHASSLE